MIAQKQNAVSVRGEKNGYGLAQALSDIANQIGFRVDLLEALAVLLD